MGGWFALGGWPAATSYVFFAVAVLSVGPFRVVDSAEQELFEALSFSYSWRGAHFERRPRRPFGAERQSSSSRARCASFLWALAHGACRAGYRCPSCASAR